MKFMIFFVKKQVTSNDI